MVIDSITGFAVNMLGNFSGFIEQLHGPEAIIFDIALILIVSAFLALIARWLKQPLIPAYVIAGLLIGPLVLGFIKNMELITAFSEIGIAFLLFTAGIEISFKKIKEAGLGKILIVGTLQILVIIALTFFTKSFFGLSGMQAAYMGIILAFGSTMVVVKLLADKGELVTLHGRLVLGILLLQDLVAIVAIIFFTTGSFAFVPISISLLKFLGIVLFAIIFQWLVLNKLFRFAASSTEFLFLISLAVLFLFVALSYFAGISIVIGAFIAGVSIANSPYKTELESRITPLRDFFAILFFVALGTQIVFNGISNHIGLFIGLLVVAFFIKPIITFLLLRFTGYKEKTSFLTAISLAQLSEFSLIIGMIGLNMNELSTELFSTVVLATIISMSVTSYLIKYKNGIYNLLEKPVSILKFLPNHENISYDNAKEKTILLVGLHRMGSVLLRKLMHKKDNLLVVDYNPEIISSLTKKKISSIYGDLTSPEILHKINLKTLKTVISTIPSFEDNLYLLKKVKEVNSSSVVIVTATRISEAKKLYEKGADYVITPKIMAGEELGAVLRKGKKELSKAKREHLKQINNVHRLLY